MKETKNIIERAVNLLEMVTLKSILNISISETIRLVVLVVIKTSAFQNSKDIEIAYTIEWKKIAAE